MGMSNSSSPNCPQCGAALPAGAPGGLCPRCLMALNLQTETVFTDDSPAAQPPLPPDQIAPHFPQLEILECLGRGGMGVVYKARQKTLNRVVALKLLAPERVNDAKFAERFAREAQALAALNHPNIVTIHDFGQAGGFYFLLMEFVDGVNLRQLLRARKFMPEEALAIVPPLCDALQFAHERGIVHRDIKPENLLLDKSGRVKVADFGIAKMLGNGHGDLPGTASAPDNATKTAMGTPGYSAPEQKSNPQHVDSRADIYSLGVVFYEMLTGELPGKRIEPPSRKVQIDVRLDQVVLRALEKTPELRYQQASEVKTCVETIAGTPLENDRRNAESGKLAGQAQPFSGTARLGAWLILPFLLSTLFWNFGHQGGTAALVGVTIASLGFIALLATTFLGWVALGQIQRSHGRLRGRQLAMLEALCLPVLLVDTAIIFLLLLANKLVNVCLLSASFPVLQVSAFINVPHYLLWLFITAAVVIGVDYAIISRVWRAANRPGIAGPATPPQPVRFSPPGMVGMGLLAIFILLLLLLALLVQPFIINTDAAAPELPRGSHFLVWKWTRNFAPGDLVAYHHANWDSVGRVSGRARDGLMVNRNGQKDVLVPYGDIIGKVISVYWRGSNSGADSGASGFYIGQASFPFGDFIEITSVYRDANQMVVKGHYHLLSQDQALLALFVTTTNALTTAVDPAQELNIAKGWGDFSLTNPHLVPGLPHVAMCASGMPFANVYFGNAAEVAAERNLDLSSAPGRNHRLERPLPSAGPWTNWNTQPEVHGFYAVAATPRETVAVGTDGRIATRNAATGVWQDEYNTSLAGAGLTFSINSATGASQTINFSRNLDFRGVIHARGQYVVVREGGGIMTSPDGLAWTPQVSPVTNNLLGVFWDGNQYLVGGDRGTLLSSPDGVTWTLRHTGSEIALSGFAYSGAKYVAVGNDGILISDDAVTWRNPATWATTARVPFTACTWTGSEFVACGLGLDRLPTIYTSPDGETWTLRETTLTTSFRAALTLNGAIYLAGDNMIAQSTDGGSTWTNLFPATQANQLFMGMATDGRFLITVGFSPNIWVLPVALAGVAVPESKPAK